ncbi:hypothetical protein [Sulfuricystis multivorans]|uniref:hypothetical protein n=1 Tax=Sulfuricystis multivorans TaxID=2211108 RepID=UPI000F8484C6|nr:hypothetical protein [Sulfuricystis multivorans]
MLNRTGVIFCSVSLVTAAVVCIGGFRLAALPKATIEAAQVPVPPESLPELDLPGFGKVSALDLIGYYIDNPPAPVNAGGGAAAAPKRFGGC